MRKLPIKQNVLKVKSNENVGFRDTLGQLLFHFWLFDPSLERYQLKCTYSKLTQPNYFCYEIQMDSFQPPSNHL